MLQQHKTYDEISKSLCVSPKKIARVAKEFHETGQIPKSLRRGPHCKIVPEVVHEIEETTLSKPMIGGQKLARHILDLMGLQISPSTVNTIRHAMHFRFQAPRTLQLLSLLQKEKRIAFTKKQLIGSIDWCNSVIISDESRFALHDDSRRVWLKRGIYNEGTFRNHETFSKSIIVWAAIGKGWRSPLIIIHGTLNADGYINMLKENRIIEKLDERYGNNGFHFQYDGAPAHRCHRTVNWMNERSKIIADWPPNSPDISCIENLWGVLKQKVAKRDPQNIPELQSYLEEEWHNLDQKVIDDLMDSTVNRDRKSVV
jgi:transposase